MELRYVFPCGFVGFDSTVFWASCPNGNIFIKNDDLTDLRLQIVGFGVCWWLSAPIAMQGQKIER
jgi:hypothetical protein